MLAYNPSNKKYDLNVKILLIGESGVGKTSLMLQFAGIDYKYRFIDVNDQRIRLEIWDTAGQERFKAITNAYLRGAQGILLVYDVTDRKSFDHVDDWMNQIKQFADINVDRVLVANKTDLDAKRQVSREEGEALAREHGMDFFEVSAKANINVEQAFDRLAKVVVERLSAAMMHEPEPVVLNIEPGKSRNCC